MCALTQKGLIAGRCTAGAFKSVPENEANGHTESTEAVRAGAVRMVARTRSNVWRDSYRAEVGEITIDSCAPREECAETFIVGR